MMTEGPNGSWSGWCVIFIPARPTPTKCSQSAVSHGRKHCVNIGTTNIDEESFIHAPRGAGWSGMVRGRMGRKEEVVLVVELTNQL